MLRVLELEEEQQRIALESARGELARIEQSQEAAKQREQRGRRLIAAGIQTGEIRDRLAGATERNAGARHAAALESKVADQKTEVSAQHERFLTKRVERRQAETLIRGAESEHARVAERRIQQSLDESHLNRVCENDREPAQQPILRAFTLPVRSRRPEEES
jgi:hypothetical protein